MYSIAVATSELFSQFSLCSLGFTVVLTASVVVMVCSMAGIPTSTTHCQVKIRLIGTSLNLTDTSSISSSLSFLSPLVSSFPHPINTVWLEFQHQPNIGRSWLWSPTSWSPSPSSSSSSSSSFLSSLMSSVDSDHCVHPALPTINTIMIAIIVLWSWSQSR